MIAAIVISVLIMMMAAGSISRFVEDHPTIKMLALSFLLLIGVTLIAEGLDVHVPRGYIYFAMAFSFGVEMLNIRVRKRRTAPIRLRQQIVDGKAPQIGRATDDPSNGSSRRGAAGKLRAPAVARQSCESPHARIRERSETTTKIASRSTLDSALPCSPTAWAACGRAKWRAPPR